MLAISLLIALTVPSLTMAQTADQSPATAQALPSDTTPPAINQPQDLFAAAVDATGANVDYTVPVANDDRDGQVPVTCDWAPGARFPLGSTLVTCRARDAAQNEAAVSFRVTVTDQTGPVIAQPADIVVDAADGSGAVVAFAPPPASDNVDASVFVGCDWGSGALFPVGTSLVTCSAQDASGNWAAAVGFHVVVNPPPPPPPTPVPTAPPPTPTPVPPTAVPTQVPPTQAPTKASPTPAPTQAPPTAAPPTPVKGGAASPTSTPTATVSPSGAPKPVITPATTPPTPTQGVTPAAGQTPTPLSTPTTPQAEPSPAPLELPWPPPGNFAINVDGGPLDGLAAIWGNKEFPISQEFGHTDFSILHFAWYAYGLGYGLDGYEHPGLDVAMPAGTWLYSPVEGTVKISGGTPYYTFYGNGSPNVGELLIETDDGDEVILGHMGRIAVNAGDRVEVGQFVGLSGGDNGDHLHLEVRELEFGVWHRIVDPRKSFVVDVLKEAAQRNTAHPSATPVPGATPVPDGEWQQPGWYESGSG